MSTRRDSYQRRGQSAESLAAVRPRTPMKTYVCSFCKDRIVDAHHVIPHEAACRMREPVQAQYAYAWRKFVRGWEGR